MAFVDDYLNFCGEIAKYGLTPNEMLGLCCKKDGIELPEFLNPIVIDRALEVLGLLEQGEITDKGYEVLGIEKKKRKGVKTTVKDGLGLDYLAVELREIYPSLVLYGVNVRSSATDVVNSLTRFFKLYKNEEFTFKEVREATKKYVERLELQNYDYMKWLKYFIIKENQSVLADEITKIREGIDDVGEQYMGEKIRR